MKSRSRLLLALSIILSGLALAPYVALPHESFSWRMFAGAYGSAPVVDIDYSTGAPGSYFTITGFNFAPGATLKIEVNGRVLGTVTVNDTGAFTAVFNTNGASIGRYEIEVEDESEVDALAADLAATPDTAFTLALGAPLRARPNNVVNQVSVPADIARGGLFLPQVQR